MNSDDSMEEWDNSSQQLFIITSTTPSDRTAGTMMANLLETVTDKLNNKGSN